METGDSSISISLKDYIDFNIIYFGFLSTRHASFYPETASRHYFYFFLLNDKIDCLDLLAQIVI